MGVMRGTRSVHKLLDCQLYPTSKIAHLSQRDNNDIKDVDILNYLEGNFKKETPKTSWKSNMLLNMRNTFSIKSVLIRTFHTCQPTETLAVQSVYVECRYIKKHLVLLLEMKRIDSIVSPMFRHWRKMH